MVTGLLATLVCCGCPILSGYRTARSTFAHRMSDSSWLSDIPFYCHSLIVRFFRFIGHPALPSFAGCPILPVYRTARTAVVLWLSDSSGLSDSPLYCRSLVVRFFLVIGHPALLSLAGCPILTGYRTKNTGLFLTLNQSECFYRRILPIATTN